MIRIFTPIASVNPVYLQGDDVFEEVIKLHGMTCAEIKEDGYRAQVHKKGKVVKAFTRSMNVIDLELYPEMQESLSRLPDCILDTELTGSNKIGKKGFDAVKTRFRSQISEERKREYLESKITQDYPLELRVFDALYWKGEELLNYSLTERRKRVQEIKQERVTPSTQRIISEPEELQKWFQTLVGTRYEGLVCKNPQSLYVPGAETTDWVKLKREETFDVAVLGIYFAKGKICHLLCGTYNEATGCYETLAKVNAKRGGMNNKLEDLLKPRKTKPKNFNVHDSMVPDAYVSPAQSPIVEIGAMELQYGENKHTCGGDGKKAYSCRLGRLKNIRDDKKKPMTTAKIIRHYKMVNA